MKNQTPNTPPVSPLALLERQLNDWKALTAQLEEGDASANQLAYCKEQITRLDNEIIRAKVNALQEEIDQLPIDGTVRTIQRFNELKQAINKLIGIEQ